MTCNNVEPSHLSRRSAIACIAGVVSSSLLAACDTDLVAPDREFTRADTPFKTFTFLHEDSVYVVISDHDDIEKFTLTVRKDGKDVETFEGVDDKTVGSIRSAYIQVAYVDAPTG